MMYIILKFQKIFNMSHKKKQKTSDCFLLVVLFSSRIQFTAIYLSFKCIQLKKNIFLLNTGTIKDKDGLMFLVLTNIGSRFIYLESHAICQSLVQCGKSSVASISQVQTFLFQVLNIRERKGENLQQSKRIPLLFEQQL